MDIYQKAYEVYKRSCEKYEVDSITFYHFVNNLSDEQIEQFCRNAS